MKFAYADPPYPGQAKRWYGNHPDYAGEVDHAELIARLERDYPDGWALSTSAAALPDVLALAPTGIRVAVWHVTNAAPPVQAANWWWCWEAVLIKGGRRSSSDSAVICDLLSCGAPSGARLPGKKPVTFCRWIFGLLGAQAGDELDDLFPGSGIVAKTWSEYAAQPWIEPPRTRALDKKEMRRALRLAGAPMLEV